MTEALLDRLVEVDEKESEEHELVGFVGTVWIENNANSVASGGLEHAFRQTNLHIHRGVEPPAESPCVVVCYAGNGEPQEAASEVLRARALAPEAVILSFGPTLDVGVIRAAVRAGAKGFVHTRMSPHELARAVCVAAEGEIVLPRALLEIIIEQERGPDLYKLKPRHRELLELISEGLTNAQMAKRLYLTESTVKQHLRSLYKVLEVKNRHEASRLLWRSHHPE